MIQFVVIFNKARYMCTIGIDFGTTNSLVAIYRDNNVELIPNSLGKYITPSVVSLLDDSSVIVGDAAKSRAITNPDLTFRTVKRYLGSDHIYKVGKKAFSAEEIASFIFKSLKKDAENYLNMEVVNAVVSVPAYFNAIQRGAVINSAKIAGLNVEVVINEPTAAALAHGIHDDKEEKTFMIFDLGGGTFDISIVEYDDGLLEVRSSAGDNFLGGENFTDELIKCFCNKVGIISRDLSLGDHCKLYKTIEKAKILLSQNERVTTSIKIDSQEYTTELSLEEFLSESDSLIQRLKKPVLRALYDSEIDVSNIDDVILVGGATRMKFVRDFIIKTMGIFPSHKYNPDEVVAIGAAIQAGLKENNENLQDVVLADVSPYTLGTAVAVLNVFFLYYNKPRYNQIQPIWLIF
jgi:molecular chaperone HscC